MRIKARARRRVAAAAAALTAAAAVGCTTTGAAPTPPPKYTGIISTPYAVPCGAGGSGGAMPDMPGMGGSAGAGGQPSPGGAMAGMDEPARLQHEPCDAQKAAARKLIADTRAGAKRHGQDSLANLKAQGYISIGDEATGTTHYVKPPYHTDQYNLDPDHIEEFAIRGGRVVAAMYILSNGMTMDNMPDIAGNWTMWHAHDLPWQSNNQFVDAYWHLGGRYWRHTAPMLHVWLEYNKCGPFTGTDGAGMTGSCVQGIE